MPAEAKETEYANMNARVPKDLLDQFDEAYPIYGAKAWLMETALKIFIAEAGTVVAAAKLRHAIREQVESRRQ